MKRNQHGFGMLEVLVSLVLVTSVGIAIVLWVENGLHSVSRLREEYERMQALRLSQSWIRAAPENRPEKGEATVGNLLIRWQKHEVARNPQAGYSGGYGEHDMVLVEYQYSVFRHPGDINPWFETSATVVHAPLVRDFKSPI